MDQGHSQSPDWLAGQASLARGSTPYWLAGVLALVSTPSRPPVFACQRLTGSRVKAVPLREHMASGMRTTLEHMQHTAVGCPSRCVVRPLSPGSKRPSSCPQPSTRGTPVGLCFRPALHMPAAPPDGCLAALFDGLVPGWAPVGLCCPQAPNGCPKDLVGL